MKEGIKIPSPCSQRFDNFSTTEKGGFCQSCQKEVVDFREMSQREILDFIASNQERSCGIFKPNQLTPSEIFHRKAKFSSFLTLGLVGFLGISFPALAQTPVKAQTEKYQNKDSLYPLLEPTFDDNKTIRGKILDKDGSVGIPGVSILLKGFRFGTATDLNGEFELKIPDEITKDQISLSFSMVGYNVMQKTYFQSQLPAKLEEIFLEVDNSVLGEYIVMIPKKSFWQKITGVFKSDPNPKCENTSHKH